MNDTKCKTPFCRNDRAKNRRVCNKCKSRNYRKNNPVKAAYYNLKSNAKRRGKEFKLTLDQFEKFCIKSNYLDKKGRSKKSLHIDRIDETKGYTIENIQVIKNSDNVKKYFTYTMGPKGPEGCHYKKEKVITDKTPF
jgi:hypothetical protein